MDWLRRLLDLLRRPRPVPPPPPPPDGDDAAALLGLHNAERARVGAGPLAVDARLAVAAQRHVAWCESQRRLSHYGPGGETWADRARAAGYPAGPVGENLAAGQRSATEAVGDWMASDGHRRNLLDPTWQAVGFGRSGAYWCALFAAPGGEAVAAPVLPGVWRNA